MKKTLFSFFALLALIACENEVFETDVVLQPQAVVADSFYVSYETALQYAARVLDEGDSTAVTRASVRSVADHYEYVANKATRSAGEAEVRFHVINYEDNQGYALVSADSRTTPVYAYSTTGNINIDDAVENTGFGDFMDAATDYYIAELETTETPASTITPVLPTPEPTNPILLLPIVEIDGVKYYYEGKESYIQNAGGVLVDVSWGQGWPYNYYCGSNEDAGLLNGYCNVAGCAPVAAAQIMSYFQYPESFGGYLFDWNVILTSSCYKNERYSYNATYSAGALATAQLIRQIGIAANTSYGVTSSTDVNDVDDMFRDFGYTCTGPVNFNAGKVISSLERSCPVYARGRLSGSSFGHAWVIDAYKRWVTYDTYYNYYEPYNIHHTSTVYGDIYYHCNWGYCESSGTWCLDVFDGYSNDRKIIYDITPEI